MSPRVLWRRSAPLLISFGTFLGILITAAGVIAYGRGYRIGGTTGGIKPTGLISATSDPIGAQVFVNGNLKTATNNSFNVDPGFYTVKVSKEGYIPWEKTLRVQGEVVSRADAFLFPTNPSLSPLTNLGIQQPTLSPDGSKIAYLIPSKHLDGASEKKAGIWVYQLADGPLGRNRDPLQIDTAATGPDVTRATMTWSPDSSELLVTNTPGISRLYEVNRAGDYRDVTLSRELILKEWEDERLLKEKQKLAAFKKPIIDFATSSAHIIAFSPDETKILYEATRSATIPPAITPALIGTNPTAEERVVAAGKIYVYDSKEDKNYFIVDKKELPAPTPSPIPTGGVRRAPTPTPMGPEPRVTSTGAPILWFPTSRHLIIPLPGKIDVMEYDRTNWITIYSGPFVDGFVAPWNNGSRVIIMTNLNPDASTLPNLYTVNLR